MSYFDSEMQEMKNGFYETEQSFTCLLCDQEAEKGLIYPVGEQLFDSRKFIQHHIDHAHGSIFSYLMEQDKEITGLSDQQKAILQLLYEGRSDSEIQEQLNIGSASTVRNHRFSLKKKEKQAKVLLTLMSLLEAGQTSGTKKEIVLFEEPFRITDTEYKAVIKKNYGNGKIRTFKLQEKHRYIVLCELAKKFEIGKVYTEKQVNELIKEAFDDHTFIRRYLVIYHFLERKTDGSAYWKKEE